MVYLKYKIFGNKKIKINAIEHNNDKSVIRHDDEHYEYKVDGNKKKKIQTIIENFKAVE